MNVHAHLGPQCDRCFREGHREGFRDGTDYAHGRSWLSLVVALVLGAILASTFLLANHVLAAPRSGVQPVEVSVSPPRQVAPATAGLRSEAPSLGDVSAVPLPEPTQLDDGGGIAGTAPPDTAVDLAHGTASFVGPSFGARYLALPVGRGVAVRICSEGRCVVRVSTDAGPDRAMQRKGRVADLSFLDFKFLCRCSPYVVGLLNVTVDRGPMDTNR